jgi:hypothetical protein
MKQDDDYSAFVGIGHNQPSELLEIAKLAEKQHAAQEKVEKLEEELKDAKEELRNLAERALPNKMDELGISEYTTTSGVRVEVGEKIRATLSPENRPKGFTWLEENGYGGMIKSEVVVAFGRNEIEEANALVDELRSDHQRLANLERKVEPSTLTAFIKEQLRQGRDIPLDVFGVFRQRIAKVEVK